jgi:hypothetical protein
LLVDPLTRQFGEVSVTDLLQAEADMLLAMEKRRIEQKVYRIPLAGGKLSVPLESLDGREDFTLDMWRGRANLLKGTYLHRGRVAVTLARVDFGGSPHRNPDGQEVGVPHLHLYREGYGDKWAYPLPQEHFPDLEDRWNLLMAFLRFCHIVDLPEFERDLLV